jgi:hypothetical protein
MWLWCGCGRQEEGLAAEQDVHVSHARLFLPAGGRSALSAASGR